MDKESKLCPAVQPFVPKIQRAFQPHQPGTPSSNPLTKHNPYQPEQSSRRNASGAPSRHRPSTAEGLWGDAGNNHAYGSGRRSRGTAEPSALRERSSCDQQMKDNNANRRSLEIQKKGVERTRSAPVSAERSKSAQPDKVAFQVKMTDFPELGIVAPGSPTLPSQEKPGGWRSAPPPSVPQPQSPAPMAKAAFRKVQRPDSSQEVAFSGTGPSSLAVAPGRLSEATSQIASPAPTGASWANIASQPPKKLVLKERTSTNTSQREETSLPHEEEASEKRKKRKKKKKSKTAGEQEVEESEEVHVHQEPPKLEDEEEFPDLAFAFATPPKIQSFTLTAKSNNEEIPKERTGLRPSDQNKDKAKTLPSESKKGQGNNNKRPLFLLKREKTVGKKSKVPVQLDIGNMLAVLEKKQQTSKSMQDAKPVILSVGGALPVGHKNPPVQKKLPWQHDKVAHNPLDSTSPLIKKGKQREVPKAKKPTPLKKIILKEREERKQNRLLEERGLGPSTEPAPISAPEEPCETAEKLPEQPKDSADNSPPVPAEEEEEEEKEENSEKKELESEDQSAPTPCLPRRPKIHSRKFREYCSQVLSKEVDECVTSLLKELVRFQDRLYQKDPMKARMKRRLVMGLREVLKHLKLRKIKCIIISPNCERSQYKGGLDEALHNIIDTCREQAVPFVFALSRKALGRCVNKAVPVSLVGVFNYDGAQDHYHKMIELSSEARRAYEVMIENLELTEQDVLEAPPIGEPQPTPCSEEPVEPEYIKLWKKMLKNECNHKILNFEETLRSSSAASESKAQMTDEEAS